MAMTTAARPKKRAMTQSSARPFKKPRQDFSKQIGAVAMANAPEKKNIDVTATLTSAGAGLWSGIGLLNQINQSTTANGRIGRRVTLKSLLVRWTTATGVFRMMAIYDRSPNGVLPVITDILTIDSINGPMNLINNDRFMVLFDEYHMPVGSTLNDIGSRYVRFREGGLQNQWTNATTGTIADITSGSIYLLAVGPSGATIGVSYTSRLRFTDL